MPVIDGEEMDFSNGTGWLALILTAAGGFIGWRVKSAQDAVRIEMLQRDNEAIKERLRGLENGSVTTATALATLAAQIEGIGRTLTRMENKLDGKADK